MNPQIPIFPKHISSSTHSIRNSFKPYQQQSTQKFTVPFVKLKHLFTKKPQQQQCQQKFIETQPSLHKKKNVTCINLEMDDWQSKFLTHPKGTFPNRLKIKQVRTQRIDQSLLNVTFYQKPKQCKRNRHKSQVNIFENYTLLAPNQQKENLKKFQKKLINSLRKKEKTQKINPLDCAHGLRLISYQKNQPNIQNPLNGQIYKPKQQENRNSSENGLDKWRLLARKHHNHQKLSSNSNALDALNTTEPMQKSKKKLSRRHSRQNTTLHTIYPQFRTGQNIQLRKSKIIQEDYQKQNINISEKHESSIFMKQKFKLAKFIKIYDEAEGQDLVVGSKVQECERPKKKLRKLLRSRKKCPSKDKNLILTPWDCIPSEKEIQMDP